MDKQAHEILNALYVKMKTLSEHSGGGPDAFMVLPEYRPAFIDELYNLARLQCALLEEIVKHLDRIERMKEATGK